MSHPSISLSIYLSILYNHQTEPTNRRDPQKLVQHQQHFSAKCKYYAMSFYDSVSQGYTTFVQFYDAHEAQTAEWSTLTDRETPWQKKQRYKSGQKKNKKKMTQRKKICFMHLETFTFWGIWAFSSNGAHCLWTHSLQDKKTDKEWGEDRQLWRELMFVKGNMKWQTEYSVSGLG